MVSQAKFDIRFFSGYIWYVYPLKRDAEGFLTLLEGFDVPDATIKLPLCHFSENAKLFVKNQQEGVIIVTDDPRQPKVPPGWEIVPLHVPEGFGGMIGTWKMPNSSMFRMPFQNELSSKTAM